jgi:hypothetical protein
MSGIVGSCKMFDLKSELCCVFREGLNHFMRNLSSGTRKYGGTLTQRKVKCSMPIAWSVQYNIAVCLVRSAQEVWEFLLFTILDVCPMYAGEQNIENI